MIWIGRIFLILFACFVAAIAAAFVLTLVVVVPELTTFDEWMPEDGFLGLAMGFGVVAVTFVAFVPVLVVVLVGEAFALRSVLYYAATGALVGIVSDLSLRGWDAMPLRSDAFARHELEIMAAAGIAAGFVYWAIAGRSAGGPRADPPLPPVRPAPPP